MLSLIEGKRDEILEEIESDFDGSGCDEYEIIRMSMRRFCFRS